MSRRVVWQQESAGRCASLPAIPSIPFAFDEARSPVQGGPPVTVSTRDRPVDDTACRAAYDDVDEGPAEVLFGRQVPAAIARWHQPPAACR